MFKMIGFYLIHRIFEIAFAVFEETFNSDRAAMQASLADDEAIIT